MLTPVFKVLHLLPHPVHHHHQAEEVTLCEVQGQTEAGKVPSHWNIYISIPHQHWSDLL